MDSYTRDNYDVIRKGNFWPMLKKAWKRAFTKKNILAGWEGTGLYPTNYRKPLSKIQHLVKSSSPKHPASSHSLSTPYTTKALKRQTIRFLQRLSEASHSEIKKSFLKISSVALGGMSEVNIEREINTKVRNKDAPIKTKDRRRFTKILVITVSGWCRKCLVKENYLRMK